MPRAKRATAATKVKAAPPATRRSSGRKPAPKSAPDVQSDEDSDIQILSDTTAKKLFPPEEAKTLKKAVAPPKKVLPKKRGAKAAVVKEEEDEEEDAEVILSAKSLYGGKDLDQYDLTDRFINDEASEDNSESEAAVDEEEEDLGEDVLSEAELVKPSKKKSSQKPKAAKNDLEEEEEEVSTKLVKKVAIRAPKKASDKKKLQFEEELEASSEEEPLVNRLTKKYSSPDWPDELVDEPSTPIKTTRTLATLGSPNTTPSPKKSVAAAAPGGGGKKRATISDQSDDEETLPIKKTKTGKSAGTPRLLEALDAPPVTPVKKRGQDRVEGPMTPGRRLAKKFGLLDIEDCYSEPVPDDWLNYDELDPVENAFVNATADTITFDEGIRKPWLSSPEKAKHLVNSIDLLTKLRWGINREYVNSGRVPIEQLMFAKIRGGNWVLRQTSPRASLQEDGSNTAFITVGALAADTNLLHPAVRYSGASTYSKYLSLKPLCYDYRRLCNMLQHLARACPGMSSDLELVFPAYDYSIVISTFPTRNVSKEGSRSASPSKARGVVHNITGEEPEGKTKEKARMAHNFCAKEMPRYMKDSFLATRAWVPIFDASAAFQGDHPDLAIDFSKISAQFPLYTHELKDGDLVAVAHSIFLNQWDEEWRVQYGLYFVVLLAHESDADDWEDKK